jgi:hypothetical protein
MNSLIVFLNTVSAVAAIKPGVLDKIEEDKLVDVIAKINGITPEIMRDQAEVDDIRQKRAAAQAAQAQLAAGQQIADVVKTGSEADSIMKQAATAHNTPIGG